MQFTINLAAGQLQRQQTGGNFFLLLSCGAAASVELWLMRGETEIEYIRTAPRGFRARLGEAGGFTHVVMRSGVAAQCEIVISEGLVDFDFMTGTTVQAQIVGQPIQVSNDRGSPGNLLYVAGVSVADAPATAIINQAPVVAGPIAVVVAAANASTRALRFFNAGPDPVALGGAGITWANRCLVLNVGDVLVEDRAANLAWSAVTDAGRMASVTVQRINA